MSPVKQDMVGPVTRRFLQARRRGLFSRDEIVQLLAGDAEYSEIHGGERLTIVGAAAISDALQDQWQRWGDILPMSIIRHVTVDESTAVGHWRRGQGKTLTYGRDTYTVERGRITRIEVEEFDRAKVPAPLVRR